MTGLRVGVLGAGYFARFHHDAWQRLDGCDLVGFADQDPDKGAPFPSLEAMLEDRTLDIIDIATPPPTHAAAIRLALEAGPQAIICQKPFCTSLAEAETLTADAEAAGTPLIVHENFRFQPWFRFLKQEIEAGTLGEVMQLSFRLRPGDGRGPEAYLDRQPYFQTMPRFLIHETGVHFVDVFRFLAGEPSAVIADLRRLNPAIAAEDAGFFMFEFGDGGRAMFDGNRHLDHLAENTRLTMGDGLFEGTKGSFRLNGDGSVQFRGFRDAAWQERLPAWEGPGFAGDCVGNLCAHVRDHLRKGSPLENEARAYLRNLEIVEAIYRSAEEGRKLGL